MIAKQIKAPEGQFSEDQIRKILLEKADTNSDGFFIKQNDFVLRTLDDRVAKKHLHEVPLDNFMTHFRWASAGKVTNENVHGWEIGDWIFSHNGSIFDYTDNTIGSKMQEKADSLQFFEDLILQLNKVNTRKDTQVAHAINNLTEDVSFWGRATLYNKKTDKMYLFGDFETYLVGGTHIVISSITLNFSGEGKSSGHGFDFTFGQSKLIGEGGIDGIGVIHNFSRPGFTYKYLDKLKKKFYTSRVNSSPTVHSTNYGVPWQKNLGFQVNDLEDLDDEFYDYRHPDYGEDRTYLLPAVNPPNTEVIETLTNETEEMAENIARAKQAGSVPIEIINLDEFDTEEQIRQGLSFLQKEFGFIGHDIDTEKELYFYEDVIHFFDASCCEATPTTCRTIYDLENMILYTGDLHNPSSPASVAKLLEKHALNSQ
jgi:hypothetical protein